MLVINRRGLYKKRLPSSLIVKGKNSVKIQQPEIKRIKSVKIEKNEIIFLFSGSGRSTTQDGRLRIAYTR